MNELEKLRKRVEDLERVLDYNCKQTIKLPLKMINQLHKEAEEMEIESEGRLKYNGRIDYELRFKGEPGSSEGITWCRAILCLKDGNYVYGRPFYFG